MQQRKTGEQRNRRRAVIFDFDGTMANSFEYVFAFLCKEAKITRSFSVIEKEKLRRMSMKRLALHLGIPVWRLPAIYFRGRRTMRAHMEHVQPFVGIDEAIRRLHEDGCQLFVASANSSKNIRRLLRSQGMEQYFTAVRGGSGYTGKAALIRQIVIRYHLPKQTTWYVGDETSDVVAATAAGLQCIAVLWGFADPQKLQTLDPTAVAKRPSDIPRILEAAWKK